MSDQTSKLRAWAKIDLDAIQHNVRQLRMAAPNSELMAVVKANAYGHGLAEVAKSSRSAGASWLGVALLSEALALRVAGDRGNILAWLPTPGDDFAGCVTADIDLSIATQWMLDEVTAAAAAVGKPARIHLKIDTGLGRSGLSYSDWHGLVSNAVRGRRDGLVEIVGIWSHLAYADSPDHPTVVRQVEVFDEAIAHARKLGAAPQLCHLANSAATLKSPQTHYDLVRPGIAIYGISPGSEVGTSKDFDLKPAMTLAGRLTLVKRLPSGHGISYAHQYVTSAETTIGLVPLGYGDGVPRISSNAGPIWAAGKRRTVAGRMCMDQFVVDFGNDEVRAGDEVILFGPGDAGEPTADDWAQVCGTIPYEIVTCVGPRVPRIFVGGN